MAGLYLGSTSGYSGKNMVAVGLGLWFKKQGLKVGYLKPVGVLPIERDGKMGDEDAFFVQEVLGLSQDPELVTPVLITQDFKIKAFNDQCGDLMDKVASAYEQLSKDKDVTIVAGSGSMYSGKYCGVDAVTMVKRLKMKTVIIDRFDKELNYDYLVVMKQTLGDLLAGVIINDVPPEFMAELKSMIMPFFDRLGIKVLGVIPKDTMLGSIKVSDLAQRLGGKVISAHGQSERAVENFLIGTMQVENFLTHFKRSKNAAVIVGGDRSDVQLVALEGDCPCLILTGNLYPNDIILTRSEVQDIPIIIVREDTFTVAKKMESILARHKLREPAKVQQGVQVISQGLDLEYLKKTLGL